MRLSQVLFTQGFGTRRACEALIMHGRVEVAGRVVDDPAADVPTEGLVFRVEGVDWPYHAKALLLMHKPAGYECSRKPRHHPGVLGLLPAPLRARDVQPVGRLDADTTGLLLLTDDGALIHRLTSPKKHVPKVYEVGTKHPVDATTAARLLAGVVLDDDPQPVHAGASRRLRADRRARAAPDPARGQVPPGQAHAGGGGQPRRDAAPQRLRRARPAARPGARRLALAGRPAGDPRRLRLLRVPQGWP